jgi:hypothetical protein
MCGDQVTVVAVPDALVWFPPAMLIKLLLAYVLPEEAAT